MKITQVSAIPLNVPVTLDAAGIEKSTSLSVCLVRIETDTGHAGHGITAITEEEVIAEIVKEIAAPAVISAGPALAQAKGGKINAIAITSQARLASAPEWPTLAQTVPGFDASPNLFLIGPAGLPEPIVARLNQSMREILARPDTLTALTAQGGTAQWKAPAQLGAQMEAEFKRWGTLVRERKITAE